ncbi:hypothetical protein Hypma_005777 [Hypsizygus marmoreus]|uniref:Uncharacterized protein n=1 Tax=Hypsizygus marmoreus TaxID=39966 RepID=A0A369KGC6_HYPMA|nr:hypothetical protein Hypma_005777 [Hypsizygus marmoreus]
MTRHDSAMSSSLANQDIISNSDLALESDIVDQNCVTDFDTEFSFDHEIPSRPTSRLSFNRAMFDSPPFTEDEISEELHSGSCSAPLNQPPLMCHEHMNHHDVDMDITALRSAQDTYYQKSVGFSLPTFVHEGASGVIEKTSSPPPDDEEDDEIDVELDSDCSSCEDSDDESDSFRPSSDSCLPSKSKPLLSPFSIPIEDSDWSIRPKYSSLPSPLSPRHRPPSAFTFRHTPSRHCYRHHGHSRHALHHLKWFWATREENWLERKARLRESKAYDGLSIFSHISPELRLPGGFLTPDPMHSPRSPRVMQQLPPMSIHPRRGDLCALRDPYCMHIDRYFVGMPLWTMAKTLWMFDVHMSSSPKDSGDVIDSEEDLFEENGDSRSEETSTGFSDDSDSTLVESESDIDLAGEEVGNSTLDGDSSFDAEGYCTANETKGYLAVHLEISPSTSSYPRKSKSDTGLFDFFTPAAPPPPPTSSKSTRTPNGRSRWATSWYRHWEVLLQLCMENKPSVDLDNPESTSFSVSCNVTSQKSQRFFFAEDDTWSEVSSEECEDACQEEVEEEPRGTVLVVVNPLEHDRL